MVSYHVGRWIVVIIAQAAVPPVTEVMAEVAGQEPDGSVQAM